MSTRVNISYALVVFLSVSLALVGCRKDQAGSSHSDIAVSFTSQFEIESKASGSSWANGDRVGIRMVDGAGATQSGYSNMLYTTNSAGAMTPSSGQQIYYPMVGNVGFVAYYPYAASLINNSCVIDISNQATPANIDLLLATTATATYNKSSSAVPLIFLHKMSKFVIKTTKGVGITSLAGLTIKIENIPTKTTFDITTTTHVASAGALNHMMARVVTDGAQYESIVIPMANTTPKVTFTLGAKSFEWSPTITFLTEKSHNYNVTINDTEIIVSRGAVTPWVEMPINDSPGGYRVGDYRNGGVIYWMNAKDSKDYKVFALEEPLVAGSRALGWSASDAYQLDAAGQSKSDGISNVVAMQTYSTNFGAAKDLAIDFPAAGWCNLYKGHEGRDAVGSWYLPAINELKELYDQWKAHTPLMTTTIAAKGGVEFCTASYWSSTESAAVNTQALFLSYISVADVTTADRSKIDDLRVRCIRHLVPPAPPVVIGDLRDGGVVYWVGDDPSQYKVVALEDGAASLNWSSYQDVIGGDAQDVTDGRKNVAAIRQFCNNTSFTFDNDYKAAAACYNYKEGGGTWYLPARDEIMLCITQYYKHPEVLTTILANSGTKMAAPNYWSATESNTITSRAYRGANASPWGSNIFMKTTAGTTGVRCIRSAGI